MAGSTTAGLMALVARMAFLRRTTPRRGLDSQGSRRPANRRVSSVVWRSASKMTLIQGYCHAAVSCGAARTARFHRNYPQVNGRKMGDCCLFMPQVPAGRPARCGEKPRKGWACSNTVYAPAAAGAAMVCRHLRHALRRFPAGGGPAILAEGLVPLMVVHQGPPPLSPTRLSSATVC